MAAGRCSAPARVVFGAPLPRSDAVRARRRHCQCSYSTRAVPPADDAVQGSSSSAAGVADHLWREALANSKDESDSIERRNASAAALVSRARLQAGEDRPWDGEEPIEVVVRRMLEDKYKPLRVPQSEKQLQQADQPYDSPSSHVMLLPGTSATPRDRGPHQPWHTVFKAPSQAATPAVRPEALLKRREGAARPSSGERLYRARDASAVYREGDSQDARQRITTGTSDRARRQRNEAAAATAAVAGGGRHLEALIDARVDRARAKGLFTNLKGRGKPLKGDVHDSNPFLTREELLLNRMVARQGAAPPWCEAQVELQASVAAFRKTLRESWTRRAVRMLSLAPITASVIRDAPQYRDLEWLARESGYHIKAVDEVNAIVRKYNVIAPASVRKTVYNLETELAAAYSDSAEAIQEALRARHLSVPASSGSTPSEPLVRSNDESDSGVVVRESMLSAFRRLVRELWSSKPS